MTFDANGSLGIGGGHTAAGPRTPLTTAADETRTSGDVRRAKGSSPQSFTRGLARSRTGTYRSVLIARGSLVPVTRMSTVRICDVGMLVAADRPVASSPAGFHDPTAL